MPHIVYNQGRDQLSYATYGEPGGFPILIQHGMIASIKDAALFQRLIDSGARLICTARPGYGESSPYILQNMAAWGQVVSALVQALKLSQFDVLGMSSGAPYSYSIGYQLPSQVRNIYIFSGTPALDDPAIQSLWPFPLKQNASIEEMQQLAQDLFFSNLSPDELSRDDIRDSMQHRYFGIAQDLRIRCMDWGFDLSALKCSVFMRHSRADPSVPCITAEMTARKLPHCRLEIMESNVHFSQETLDDFFQNIILQKLM